MGSAGGVTTVLTDNLTIEADAGYAQLGYVGGGGSGNITVDANGNVSLTASSNASTTGFYAQIGNGGYLTNGNDAGNIVIDANGYVSMNGGAGKWITPKSAMGAPRPI